jgi:WD40 repeat protein
MNRHHEKLMYLYSRALEDADFEAISQIMAQAARDPDLQALLFDLEAAYQAELPARLPAVSEIQGLAVPEVPMIRSNGYHPAPAIRLRRSSRPRTAWAFRAAVLGVIVLAVTLFARHTLDHGPDGISTTRIAPNPVLFGQNQTPVPLAGHPAITAQNASQLAEVRRFGTGAVASMAWSPDSQTLLYAGAGLWFYDATTFTAIRRLDTGTFIDDATYSPDGTRIATASRDRTIRLYDVASGAEQVIIPVPDGWASQIVFSPDGSLIAASDGESTVRVWDVVTGRERLALHDITGTVRDLKFSPDGTLLAAAGEVYVFSTGASYQGPQIKDGVHLWTIPGGEDLLTLYGPTAQIGEISFHPDSQQLIAASWDGLIYHWTLEHATPISAYEARLDDEKYFDPTVTALGSDHLGFVLGLAYSPDGTWIASLDTGMTSLRFWQEGKVIGRFNPFPDIVGGFPDTMGLTFSPDGQRLLITLDDGVAVVWDVSDPAAAQWIATLGEDHNAAFVRVDLSPDGSRIAAAETNRGAWLWNTDAGEQVNHLDYDNGAMVNDLTFDPTGTWLALAQNPMTFSYGSSPVEANYPLLLWNTDPAVELLFLTEPGGRPLYALAFNADGTRLFTGGNGGRLQAWDISARTQVGELDITIEDTFQTEAVYRLASNPAGTVVAFLDFERSVRLWDVTNNVELPALTGHSESVQAVAFSPDGAMVAATDQGGTLIVWDTATWAESWYQPEAGGSAALAFSPDGSLLAVAGYTEGVTLWDTATRQKVLTLTDQPGGVPDLAFSADGSLLVTAGGDGTVRLWAVP